MSESEMETESDQSDIDSESDLVKECLREMRRTVSSPTAPGSVSSTEPEIAKVAELSKIEEALSLNRQSDEKLQRLEKVLEQRLYECRNKLQIVRGQNKDTERQESFRYINCGRPYFKDKGNFWAPDNSDTLIMAKNHMYDFSTITCVPGWTMRDKTNLWNQIEKMTINMKKKELQSKISALTRDCSKKKCSEKKALQKKINELKRELTKVNKKRLHKIALPIEEEYDWEEITHSLDRRHSASEYRALWKLYLHPSINKSCWDKAEHQLLQKVALGNQLHGWEDIAKKMGKNRTGYQCFVYFRTNMNNTFTGKKWTAEEVAYLLRLIDYYKEDNYIPWSKVAGIMENRTKIQIYNKYTRLMEQRKGRFLSEEDAVILTCADEFGPDYKKMLEFLPGRSLAQVRVRYQALNKNRVVSTVWTVEEDKKLLQLLSNQDNTANYASITKYFPGKDRINIRARYVTLVRWMRKNPNTDIIKAPRRGARRLGHGRASDNLSVAIESLKSRIQSEVQKKKKQRITIDSTEEVIEDSIIAALYNESLCNDRMASCEKYDTETQAVLNNNSNIQGDAVNEGNLQKILILLKASLNKSRFEKGQVNSPKLSKVHEVACVVKVKSYSKQNKIKSIKLNSSPDIWGNNTLKNLEYILPPQYATITGCRKLMKHVAAKQHTNDNILNFSLLERRNVILREQLELLMERFNTLFLWPMFLSNEGPNLKSILPNTSAVSISENERLQIYGTSNPGPNYNDKIPYMSTSTIMSMETDVESD